MIRRFIRWWLLNEADRVESLARELPIVDPSGQMRAEALHQAAEAVRAAAHTLTRDQSRN